MVRQRRRAGKKIRPRGGRCREVGMSPVEGQPCEATPPSIGPFFRRSSMKSLSLRSRARPAPPRTRLRLEALEDRTVPATLYVVVPGTPLDATHFTSYHDAYQQTAPGDTIQVEPGAAVSSVGAGVQ